MGDNFFVNQAEGKAKEIEPENQAVVAKAQALKVVDDQAYELAAEIGQEATRRIKFVKDSFMQPRTAAHAAWKAIVALEKRITDPLETVKKDMSKKMGAYSLEKEKKARAEEEERLAKAKEKAAQERLEHAEKLEQAGDQEGATRVLNEACEPDLAPTAQPVEKAPKVDGVTHRKKWGFRITSTAAIPREYMTVDESKIRKVVQALGGETRIPGVEIFEERVTAFK
jgi:hypothetical protein